MKIPNKCMKAADNLIGRKTSQTTIDGEFLFAG